MASQALYRQYRSQTFDELIGQEHVVQTLRNALLEGRIAHAYLFTGPRGVGKTTVARLLAKAVNCLAEQHQRPCGTCASCQAIAEGRAVDVIEMDAASHTSVDDAREIIERVQFRPTSGAYKVYIIDEVHMLSTAAFNALLKTLEEPPDHAIFVLATTENHKVPATILSRCQRFTFNRHTIAATVLHLKQIAIEEGVTLEQGVAEAIARASTGSLRDALSVLDQLMAYGSGTIRLEQVRSLLGAVESQEVAALVDALIEGDLTGALHAIAAVAHQGADLRQFIRDLVERLRALLLLKAGSDAALLDATDEDIALLQSQAARGILTAFLSWVKLFSGLDHQLRTSPYGQLPIELAVVEAISLPSMITTIPPEQHQGSASRGTTPTPSAHLPARPQAREPAAIPPPPISSATQAPHRPRRPTSNTAVSSSKSTEIAPPVQEASLEPRSALSASMVDPDSPTVAPESTQTTEFMSDAARLPADGTSDPVDSTYSPVISPQWLETYWEEIVYNVRPYNVSLPALLRGCSPGEIEGDVAKIWVKHSFHKQKLEQHQNIDLLERIIQELAGHKFLVQFEMFTDQQEVLSAHQRRKQRAELRKDPHISAAVRIFDADIEDIEPNIDERRTSES